jgi:putative toxin-antitoxin system antitoxin component (TIGR02293 family)
MSSLTIETLLGGKEVIGQTILSEMDLYELGREGIPKKALLDLADQTSMSLRTLASILQISERTLQRKKDSDLLNRSVSEHVIQIAQIFSRGNEVFDSFEDFQTWISTANKALGNREPIRLLSSRYGAQMILDELERIEHGVFS